VPGETIKLHFKQIIIIIIVVYVVGDRKGIRQKNFAPTLSENGLGAYIIVVYQLWYAQPHLLPNVQNKFWQNV